nr:MAG: ribonuclease E [Pseudomonadota bacterium]
MSSNKMLIDATHPEETRVVVLKGGRVEEFDYESAARKLLRGNIYLAKITRVEPSLQAAFVDYGGNRHGFLAFNEIHPDYYQIPVADRQALLEEEAAAEAEEEAAADREAEQQEDHREEAEDGDEIDRLEERAIDVTEFLPPEPEAPASLEQSETAPPEECAAEDTAAQTVAESAQPDERLTETVPEGAAENGHAAEAVAERTTAPDEEAGDLPDAPKAIGLVEDVGVEEVEGDGENGNGNGEVEQLENIGAEDALEEVPSRPRRRLRSYKIQEVIKRRQIVLVQVVKEERGSKGAALTTYLSLAGRYTVLMPNTARGGGISRKITNIQDRKRLKAIAAELDVPEGMGLIIRTAGASRTKQEIKRDFEYLLRLWESVRELTLRSTAPTLVYEEGNLIKRAIRDLYTKDIDEIIVAGEAAYKEARDFMRMLMPSHVKNVVLYQDPEPLFSRYQVERQLAAMFSPYVHLKSGGYLVINQTEALVAIDVNSGKATREFSIEETALQTNLEAADEIARQLRLRDLAGLIVIDFIDMEEKRNNRAVERRLKEALRNDRARIQVGRISHFGLLEMSRQRLRSGVLEGSTTPCPHCQGTGIIRSTESVALAVIRAMEDALMSGPPSPIVAKTTVPVALYILNNKRAYINEMESRYGVSITVEASDKVQGANFLIEKAPRATTNGQRQPERSPVSLDWGFQGVEEEAEETGHEEEQARAEEVETRRSRRRRRRRGRRGGARGEHLQATPAVPGNGADGELMYAHGEHDLSDHEHDISEEDEEEEAVDEAVEEVSFSPDEEPAEAVASADDVEDGEEEVQVAESSEEPKDEQRRHRRGRRRGRRGGRRDRDGVAPAVAGESGVVEANAEAVEPESGPVLEASSEAPVQLDATADQTVTSAPDSEDVVPGAEVAIAEPESGAVAHAEAESGPAMTEQAGAEPAQASTAPPVASVPALESQAEGASQEQRPSRTPRTEPVASEPIIERIVLGPEIGAVTPERPTPSEQPARRGWWQRRFGVNG